MRKVSHNYCELEHLIKKDKDNAKCKVQSILVLKFFKQSNLENNVMQVEMNCVSFII